MPLRKPRRLPRKYNRPVTKQTRKVAMQRRKMQKQWKRDRLRRWIRRAGRSAVEWRRFLVRSVLVGVFCTLLLTLGLLLFSSAVRISAIHVVRTDPRLDLEQVAMILTPLYGQHLILVSTYEVASLLKEAMPDIEDVSIEKIYPQELRVSVTLTPLSHRLSIESPDAPSFQKVIDAEKRETGSGMSIDFLTENGYYVQVPASEEYETLPLLHIVDWGARPLPDTLLLSPDLITHMQKVEQILTLQFGQAISHRSIFLRAQEYHLHTDAYTLWFDTKSSVEEHMQRYRTFLEILEPEQQLRYVDLRLTTKVIYR